MKTETQGTAATLSRRTTWGLLILLLVAIFAFLFSSSFSTSQALFANDGPLAAQKAEMYDTPSSFFGIWIDLYWLGLYGGNFMPNSTGLLRWFLGPHGYINFYAPLGLMFLGLAAAFHFRQLRFGGLAIILGGLAAALNSNFFSNACWGLPTRATCLAFTFLALAAVHSSRKSHFWIKSILAGLAIGMAISEGADNGAIFSLFVAAYAFYLNLISTAKPILARAALGVAQVAVMAVLAAVLAAQTLNIFAETSVKGIVGTEQTAEARAQKWDQATQWSLPKLETLRVIIPGLFGYRMDTEEGGQYWGRVGEWGPNPAAMPRSSGAGEYAGVLVVLIGVWALAQSFRRKDSAYDLAERRVIWFWGAMALVAMGLGWGRHAPFYQFIYSLPYFSTIRNPMKFFHPLHMILMILFAYGVEGLTRLYLKRTQEQVKGLSDQIKGWWRQASAFEKKWTYGSFAAVGVSALAFLAYARSKDALVQKLKSAGLQPAGGESISSLADDIAATSIGEVGLYLLFLTLSVAVVFLIQSRWLAGARAKWAGVLLGLVLVVDLARANAPWIIYYNWQVRYASNPVIDILKEEPHEGRIAMPRPPIFPQETLQRVFQMGNPQSWTQDIQRYMLYLNIYNVEWLQHAFQMYDIQSLDIAQEPRPPVDKANYLGALTGHPVRLWELTNTRWLGGVGGGFADALNGQLDPEQQRFRLHTLFNFFQKPNSSMIGVETNTVGPFALVEFTGALPRAKIYTRWQVNTNDQEVLATLADPRFDPHQTVLVSDAIAGPPATSGESPASASAEIASYAPKHLEIAVTSPSEGILLLNDKHDGNWKVTVDGSPAELLRCNYIMRGVRVPAGDHVVVFDFQPPTTFFWISTSAIVAGLLLCGFLWFDARRGEGHEARGTRK